MARDTTVNGGMVVEYVDPATLKADPKNARTSHAIDAIAESIDRFGFADPIEVQRKTNRVIAGHGRLEAARRAGLDRVPVVFHEMSNKAARDYALANNRLTDLSTWDVAVLRDIGDELLDVPGFDADFLDGLVDDNTTDPADIDEDEVPEPPDDPVTKPGDVWTLGDHRLLCGDSTDAGVAARAYAGDEAAVIWTDPPYGVNHIGGTKDPRRKTHRSGGVVNNDDLVGEALTNFVASALRAVPVSPTASVYVASPAGSHLVPMVAAFAEAGFVFRHSLAWVKHAFVFGRADYHYQHELVLYGWAKTHEWVGPRNLSTVFNYDRGDKMVAHPTSKPVELVATMICNHPGELVADPFAGSGTTLIAAAQLNRRARVVELDPAYCDVIVERWQNLTGGKATREGAK